MEINILESPPSSRPLRVVLTFNFNIHRISNGLKNTLLNSNIIWKSLYDIDYILLNVFFKNRPNVLYYLIFGTLNCKYVQNISKQN